MTERFEGYDPDIRNAEKTLFNDRLAQMALERDPERRAFAQEQANLTIQEYERYPDQNLPEDFKTAMKDGLTKTIFALTAKDDFSDTISGRSLVELLEVVASMQPDRPLLMVENLNNISSLIVVARVAMEERGQLLDVPIGEQLWHIFNHIDELIE